ncbi:thiol-disulfide oxidoreductase DCC family protein [Bradyrhizobium sp. LHD-71]|uniref:thiol-disulfide oxidoreductase DCC family protein n=1 Tax=Bradyrhizobium sp. LHD-71 TaxID=3072141 RepID=UPI00280CCA25|nr:thiol-disulfide oxidoreductase DCC family protein [Bradyrhizobium sp. LHD-71]MDQ8731630.1 thiol-disulfide oxidoreductase DCC family protein [Bradyrhizobium sp. LHD-71]
MKTDRNGAVPMDHPIIVFDAECVLCSANAQFVLRHDREHVFRLASMQGEVGAALYKRFGIDPANPETLILVQGGELLRDSGAIIAIYSALGWPWRMMAVLYLVPAFVRDPAYRWIARNRYRIFGRRQTCWLPSAEYARYML